MQIFLFSNIKNQIYTTNKSKNIQSGARFLLDYLVILGLLSQPLDKCKGK